MQLIIVVISIFLVVQYLHFCLWQKQNFRYYNQKKLEWRNHGRSNALDDTPFDITLLIDIDYFCFTDNLLQLMDTEYDFLCHDSIFDVSGQNKIMTPHESSLPLVWATCCVFKKTEETKKSGCRKE